MKNLFIYLLIFFLPWFIRRYLLIKFLGHKLHKSSFISRFALINPNYLEMKENSKIDAFSVAIHLDQLIMHEFSLIGRSNWISGFPLGSKIHFSHIKNRRPDLIIGKHSAITKKHIIDCTNSIVIGNYTTIAGYQSQFLTHSIDYKECRQDCMPITIGDYCIVGTGCIFLPGSSLPNYSICGAGSVVNKKFVEEYHLYAGTPAILKATLEKDSKYFSRNEGFVC